MPCSHASHTHTSFASNPHPPPLFTGSSASVHSRAPYWLHRASASLHVALVRQPPSCELPHTPSVASYSKPSSEHRRAELAWKGIGGGEGGSSGLGVSGGEYGLIGRCGGGGVGSGSRLVSSLRCVVAAMSSDRLATACRCLRWDGMRCHPRSGYSVLRLRPSAGAPCGTKARAAVRARTRTSSFGVQWADATWKWKLRSGRGSSRPAARGTRAAPAPLAASLLSASRHAGHAHPILCGPRAYAAIAQHAADAPAHA